MTRYFIAQAIIDNVPNDVLSFIIPLIIAVPGLDDNLMITLVLGSHLPLVGRICNDVMVSLSCFAAVVFVLNVIVAV